MTSKIRCTCIIIYLFICRSLVAQTAKMPQAYGDHSPKTGSGNGILFTPNNGQLVDQEQHLRPDILFKGSGGGMDIYLRKTGISYVLSNIGEVIHEIIEKVEEKERAVSTQNDQSQTEQLKEQLMQSAVVKLHRIDMNFVGANDNIKYIREEEVGGYQNYYYPHCPNGISNVHQFNRITGKNIYNNIDVVYYGNKEGGVKYDIIVKPGANPDQIKLNWTGAEELKIENGRLVIKNSVNEFYESMPKVYQNIGGRIIDINAKYKLSLSPSGRTGDLTAGQAGGLVTFELGTWNPEFPLVIDPATWITYYGGSDAEAPFGIKVDNSDNVIVVGKTRSVNFPITVGVFQAALNTTAFAEDYCLIKMDVNGNRSWATFYGGDGTESTVRIATDGNNIFMAGTYGSTNFPLTTAVFKGIANDAFLIKFGPGGNRLWATSYGGKSADFCNDVAVDPGNNVIITGYTISSDFPVTGAAYQLTSKSPNDYDAYIAKFDGNGTRLWATYVGGSVSDQATCIGTDKQSNIIIAGSTTSNDFPVSPTAFQNTTLGLTQFGFIFKVSPNGNYLWSTYYGATAAGFNLAYKDVITDSNNDIIIGGTTNHAAMATPGVCQTTLGGVNQLSNCFVSKFSSAGARIWATYYARTYNEFYGGIAVDEGNNIFLLGESEDVNAGNFSSPCAFQKNFGGVEDQFITKFNPNGTCNCHTYLGGSAEDELENTFGGIFCKNNFMYITVTTMGGYPVTPGAFQTLYGGPATPGTISSSPAGDIAIAKLCSKGCGDATKPTVAFVASPTSICAGTPANFTDQSTVNSCDPLATKWQWSFPGGTPSSSTLQNPGGIVYNTPGTYNVKLVVTTCLADSLIQNAYITVNACGCINPPVVTVAKTDAACNSANGTIVVNVNSGTGTGPFTYTWSNGATTQTNVSLSAGTYNTTVTDAAGCKYVVANTINNLVPVVTIDSIKPLSCSGGNTGKIYTSVSGGKTSYSYLWSSGQTIEDLNGLSAGTYSLTLTDANGCTSSTTATINKPIDVFVTKAEYANCLSGTATDGSISLVPTGASPFTFLWSTSPAQTGASLTGLSPGNYTVTVTDVFGCTTTKNISLIDPTTLVTQGPVSACSGTTVQLAATITGTQQSISFPCGTTSACSGPDTTAVLGSFTPMALTTLGPYSGANTDHRMQLLYLASALKAAGANAGRINALSFYVTTKSSTQPYSGFTLKMGCTTATSLGFTWVTGLTTVYGPVNYTTAAGWNIHNLSIPYNWDGKSNIVVEVCWDNTTISANDIVAGYSGSSAYNSNTNNSQSGCAIASVGTSASAPTIRFSYCKVAPQFTWTPAAGLSDPNIFNPILYMNSSNPTTYTVTVTGINGCTKTQVVPVQVNSCGCSISALTGVNSNLVCNGGNTGSAKVTISSGTGGPYTFNWSNGSSGTTTSTFISLNNLTAGTYTVTITEGSCKSISAVTITQPPSLVINLPTQWSCPPNTALITAMPSNGTSPYTYIWNNGQTTQIITGITPGTYTLTVRDQNNCASSQVLNLTLPAAMATSITSTNISCTTSGSATVTTTAGNTPFSYSWSTGQTAVTSQLGASTISCPTAGVYTVTVTDGIGCTITQTFNITGTSPVSATFTNTPPCVGTNVTFTNTGSTGTYSWSIGTPVNVSGTTVNFSYTFLSVGTYSVTHTVTNAGCTNTITQTINVTNCSSGPTVTAAGNSVCPSACALVNSTVTGGSAPYTYAWSTGATTQNINPCPSATTTYSLTITDSGGAKGTTTVMITVNPAVSVTIIPTNISCYGGTNGSTLAATGGGTPGYTYNWSNGAAGSLISGLSSGTYTVTVSDSKGCTATSIAAVSSPPAISGQFTKGSSNCSGCGCKEWIMINATGGTSPYSYSWPDGYGNRYKNQLCPGAYSINIKDKNGCSMNVNLTAP